MCVNVNMDVSSPQELPKLLQDLATTDADLPWNKSKNRFPNIKPCEWSGSKSVFQSYDTYSFLKLHVWISSNINCMWNSPPLALLHSTCSHHPLLTMLCLDNNNRVKLLSEPGTAGSDYINASFVSVSTSYQPSG